MKGSEKSPQVFRWSDPGAERELQEVICSCIFLSDLPERTFAAQVRESPLQEERIAFPLWQQTLKRLRRMFLIRRRLTRVHTLVSVAPRQLLFHWILLMKMPFKYVFPSWRSQLGLRAHYETGLSWGVSGGSD